MRSGDLYCARAILYYVCMYRSMNDLDAEVKSTTPVSPNKRKFSFRFPSTGHHDHDAKSERRNFSDEAQSIPDLQVCDSQHRI